MNPLPTLPVSALIESRTADYAVIAITPGVEKEPWVMYLFHRISENMGPQRSAAYVAERYLIDHPFQLVTIGRAAITEAVMQAFVS